MVDNLTAEQRSYCMSRIKSKDTKPELAVRSELHRRGFRFRKHFGELPGKPDIVFTKARVVVFVDGGFWHGYRFSNWQHKVPEFWREKIAKNRKRDIKNHRALRELGWTVVRIWQHELERDFEKSIRKVTSALDTDAS